MLCCVLLARERIHIKNIEMILPTYLSYDTLASFWQAIVSVTSTRYGLFKLLKKRIKASSCESRITQTHHEIWMNLLVLSIVLGDDCIPLSKWRAIFFVYWAKLHLASSCSSRVAVSHGTCESAIHISSEKTCELKSKYNRKYQTL